MGLMSLEELRAAVADGSIDTVVVAMTDMQGRLQGKRLHAQFFLDEVAEHGTEACDYLLAVDTEMNTVSGYVISSWETGYGDIALAPDMGTLRVLPWQPGTALVLADVNSVHDGSPISPSPRQILRTQLERAAEQGWICYAGTELEFIVFEGSYEQAWDSGYRGLIPANRYNVDYSVLGTSRVEPLLRDIRNEMTGAGLRVESAKGECNLGQHEIAFRYMDALTTADQHVLYKTGAKEIAARHGYSLTFMAKVNEREGNSCHIHVSFRDADGTPVMAGDGPYGLSAAGAAVIAGIQAGLRELTLLYAPTVNSYKRYCPGSFAPTAVAWGPDNRTCALRLVGRGSSLRVECRVPGGDVNPYLAIAGLVCAAMDGVERELPLPPPVTGNGYTAPGVDRVPATLAEAAALWEGSALARAAFGKEVVDHYANMARVELAAYQSAVTDWELRRYFERFLPGVFDVHDVVNPATEQVVGSVPDNGAAEAEEMVRRAVSAAAGWARVSAADRSRLLAAFAAEVDRELESLAALAVAEAGHPVTAARWEASNVRDVLAYYSGSPERLLGAQIPAEGGLNVTFHEPLGVVGVIVPWNFPLPIAGWGLAPALAAGNAVIVKPAELTPLTAIRLGELALSAGLPPGVLQVLPGRGSVVGQVLVDHRSVRKICFTGSVSVGQSVMAACAAQVKRVTLELGGKSANIVFADADLERAAATAPYAVFDNAGQDCCARSRILVQRPVYERFMALFEAAVKGVAVGDPTSPEVEMGPLISAAHRSKVAGYVGPDAPVAFRGSVPAGPGFWYPPTVLTAPLPVMAGLPAWREEVFGPVVCVTAFDSEDEAVALANDTEYGLSGSIWTRDAGRAIRVARGVQSGNLSVNSHSSVRYTAPFGGFKQSGLGRELGPAAAEEFTEVKTVFFASGG